MTDNPLGKNALVTGGTDGVGKEIARGLAGQGIRTFIVGRDARKGARAERELRDYTGNQAVEFISSDLALMNEVHRLADKIAQRCPELHYLVHSAGVVRGRRENTREGIESNFAIGYLSRFALTRRLLPLLQKSGHLGSAARIILISGAAQNGRIYFEDVNLTRNFTTPRAVAQLCQANDVFTIQLARTLAQAKNPGSVTITCLKLGSVKTNIRRGFPRWMKLLVPILLDPWLTLTPPEAAEPALNMLLDKDCEGVTGALFSKIKKFKQITPAPIVLDPEIGLQLWKLSDSLSALDQVIPA